MNIRTSTNKSYNSDNNDKTDNDDNEDDGDDHGDDDDDVAGPTDPDGGLNKPIARRPKSRSKQPCALL